MSTVEDFRNAPVGATATHKTMGIRVMKVNDGDQYWIVQSGGYLSDEEVALRDFALDTSAPATAREALGLAWELAHEVKEGQTIPEGTQYLEFYISGMRGNTAQCDFKISPGRAPIRTLEPLPEPEPDWLDAPAVLATCGCRGIELWQPHHEKDNMWVNVSGEHARWSTLRDVTPLYPKEGQKS